MERASPLCSNIMIDNDRNSCPKIPDSMEYNWCVQFNELRMLNY